MANTPVSKTGYKGSNPLLPVRIVTKLVHIDIGDLSQLVTDLGHFMDAYLPIGRAVRIRI